MAIKRVLAFERPDLLKEWDFEKNVLICAPDEVSVGTHRKVWWKCKECGHEWFASIHNRTNRNAGCPKCAGKKAFKGYNDLQSTSNLIQEWNYEKNTILPDSVTNHSDRKVWWKCSACGYEWEATINNRAHGSGCPNCQRMFQTSVPEQIVFYYIKQLFPHAQNRVSIYKNEVDIYIESLHLGIEYDGKRWHKNTDADIEKAKKLKENGINLIRIREYGCAKIEDGSYVINTKKPNKNYLYMQETVDSLIEHIKTTYQINALVDINVERDLNAIIISFKNYKHEQTLRNKYPELSEEWSDKNYPLTPDNVLPFSALSVWWKCKRCGAEWKTDIGNRVAGHGCMKCSMKNKPQATSQKNLVRGENDVATLYPLLVKEWDYQRNIGTPSDYTTGSGKKMYWICSECGNKWRTSISTRCNGRGCPKCGKRKMIATKEQQIISTKGSLLDTNPEVCKEWDNTKNNGLLPSEVYSRSKKKVWWKCSRCGHEWKAQIVSRSDGSGCPVCAGNVVLPGHNDLATLQPELIKEWDFTKNTDISPQMVTEKSGRKVWWKCSQCGFEWNTRIASRSNGSGCPNCKNINNIKRFEKSIICIETGIIYESVTIASEKTGIYRTSLSAALNGRTRTAGGYHWKYVNK